MFVTPPPENRPNLRAEIFPPLKPLREGRLPLDGGHVMHWSEAGNPRGIPVLFVHGGPGAGCAPSYRRFFDPRSYRIVLYDQRGAGASRPNADIHANTTSHLVGDIEALRRHLGIERWLVFGGSWGSTLALVYGQAFPERVLGFVLRGIFLGEKSEVDWFLHGMARIFPEAHRAFAGHLPAHQRGDILAAYYRRLTDPDPLVHMPAARVWSRYESVCSTLRPTAPAPGVFGDRSALSIARIEAHYFINDLFLRPGQIIDDIGPIRHLPCVIVHGRYDIVCPVEAADRLASAWPEAEFVIVPDAGHSAMEPGIRAALVRATENLKLRFSSGG